MKKKFIYLILIALSNSIIANAQDVVKTMPSMNVNPIFIGGNLVIGGGAGSFQLGLNPEMYKRVNDYVDIGAATNLFFQSFNPTISNGLPGVSSRSFQLGAGAFTRIWPLEKFFIQIQPEYNYTWSRFKDRGTEGINAGASRSIRFGAESLLAGIGYGTRSENGMTYFSVMIDLLKNPNSPYRDGYNRADPIIRAGFAFPILSAKKKQP
jgi:opacity protein-like surface antigen